MRPGSIMADCAVQPGGRACNLPKHGSMPSATDCVCLLCNPRRAQKRRKPKKTADDKERAKRLDRGPGVNVKQLKDKKLKGKLKHAERVYREAQAKATKANEWLLPADAGYLETEGGWRSLAVPAVHAAPPSKAPHKAQHTHGLALLVPSLSAPVL